MVNREQLKRLGLRAYEVGRLRVAARAAWILVPVVLVCMLETGERETCACLGVLLLGASFFLRWRDRQGADSVRDGLLAGALPLLAGLAAARVAPACADAPLLSVCTAVCLGIGVPSGVWLGVRLVRGSAPASTWLGASGIAVLAASLGCAGLGISGLIGAGAGLVLGAASAKVLSRAPT
ncbi:hypothetical protein WME97_05405 [Sorangium sp. So ce367]|uniref:hypothetical protein n=1 Tax=Sorangium sp. So ce367 TaxID=3133305 RepID=UPI003F60C45E